MDKCKCTSIYILNLTSILNMNLCICNFKKNCFTVTFNHIFKHELYIFFFNLFKSCLSSDLFIYFSL